MMMGKKFKGIGCPCVTPFGVDDSVDKINLRELVDFLINSEINAIIPTSSCGEPYSLNDAEYQLIIDTVIDQVNNEVPVYVGLPSESTNRLLKISKYCIDAGVDGVVIYPPKIPTLSSNELVSHYEFLSSKIEENILFVNDPDRSGIDFSVELIRTISKFPHIVGVIELSSDFKKISQITSEVSDDFLLYTGRGLLVPQAIKEGGVEGAIVPSANVVPNLLVELYEAFNVEMMDRFDEIQAKLIPLEIGLKLGSFPAAIKASLNLLGVNVGNPRKPLSPLSESDLEKLRNILISVGCLRPPAKEEEEEEEEPPPVEQNGKKKEVK
ncbi:MAG: dihydrodipicolinate synthase family protein [Candidatus Heimdallarchaeota archaeon]|nr:dihydrodipicolinate synthase family protein [Candidatus Heimdallarchaeota archaeon]